MSFWEKALFDLDWPKFWIWKKLRQIFDKFYSKGHISGIFILVSQYSPIILASFKSKILNLFCLAIFWHFWMVWFRSTCVVYVFKTHMQAFIWFHFIILGCTKLYHTTKNDYILLFEKKKWEKRSYKSGKEIKNCFYLLIKVRGF